MVMAEVCFSGFFNEIFLRSLLLNITVLSHNVMLAQGACENDSSLSCNTEKDKSNTLHHTAVTAFNREPLHVLTYFIIQE